MRRPEQALQIRLVHTLRIVAPDVLVWHTPNGGKRDAREAALFKAMGVLPGIPDLGLCWAIARIGFMELKAGRNGPTAAQAEMHERLKAMGFLVAIALDVEEALAILRAWGAPVRGRIAA